MNKALFYPLSGFGRRTGLENHWYTLIEVAGGEVGLGELHIDGKSWILSELGKIPIQETYGELSLLDFVMAWWIEQFEKMELTFGDTVCIVGPPSVIRLASSIAVRCGAGRILSVNVTAGSALEIPVRAQGSIESWVAGVNTVALEDALEKWFSDVSGLCVLCALDLDEFLLTQCFKVLPRWGSLIVGTTGFRKSLNLPVDLYRDIHKRGNVVEGFHTWTVNSRGLLVEERNLRVLLKRAVELRRQGDPGMGLEEVDGAGVIYSILTQSTPEHGLLLV